MHDVSLEQRSIGSMKKYQPLEAQTYRFKQENTEKAMKDALQELCTCTKTRPDFRLQFQVSILSHMLSSTVIGILYLWKKYILNWKKSKIWF
jgi:hypothetical protein